MAINTASGSQFSIGTTLAATTISGFEADVYVPVGEVEDLGEFGDASAEVTFTSLLDARVRKAKGPRDAGSVTVTCADDPLDVGQDNMILAEASTLDYNFKVEFNDPLSVSGTPSIHYFKGKVMSKRFNVGNASNIVRRVFVVGINSEILSVNPS